MVLTKGMRFIAAAAATLVLAATGAASSRLERALDVMSAHGVWYSRNVYLPFYSDTEVVAYLANIPSDVLLVPVYTAAPIHFRRGQFVFVSTGLILQSRNEAELLAASLPAPPPPDEARFQALQARLRERIAEYEADTQPHLRRRQ